LYVSVEALRRATSLILPFAAYRSGKPLTFDPNLGLRVSVRPVAFPVRFVFLSFFYRNAGEEETSLRIFVDILLLNNLS
jgi:hypothetical protein